jgi:hypothetical protein
MSLIVNAATAVAIFLAKTRKSAENALGEGA